MDNGDIRIMIFAIDGLNRSGKGTQLDLLQKYLQEERRIPTYIFRGQGRKTGVDEDVHYDVNLKDDQGISYWEKFKYMLKLTKKEQHKKRLWDKAAEELESEFLYFKQNILPAQIKNNKDNGLESKLAIVLLDRSLISRFNVRLQSSSSANLKQVYNKCKILPDNYFLFDVEKDTLLKRLEGDTSKKKDFRQQMLTQNYHYWQQTIPIAQDFFRNNLTVIDCKNNKGIEPIHKEITKIVDNYLRDSIYLNKQVL